MRGVFMSNNSKNELVQMISTHEDLQCKLLEGLKRDYENDIFSNLKETDPEEYKKSREELLSQIKELEEKIKTDQQRDLKMVNFLKQDNVTVDFS